MITMAASILSCMAGVEMAIRALELAAAAVEQVEGER
jgi:hypothetical protein